jgi:thioredoxin 1
MSVANLADLNGSAPVWVVCLCADWCGVCREYRLIFKAAAARHPSLRFAWIDVEDQAELVGDLDIDTFPTLMVLDDSGVHFQGAIMPQAGTLLRLVDSLLLPDSQVVSHGEVSRRLASTLPSLVDLQVPP